MVLRRVISASRVTSHLLHDFIISSSGRIIVLIGVLLGLSALEVNLAPLLAVIGAAGFVVAFALQGTLSNFASGLLIMVNKPFDVGDEVEVGGGIKGRVTRVSIFSTYIETDDGFMKIVPNDNIWKSVIVNQTTGVVKAPPAAEAKPADAKPAADRSQKGDGRRPLGLLAADLGRDSPALDPLAEKSRLDRLLPSPDRSSAGVRRPGSNHGWALMLRFLAGVVGALSVVAPAWRPSPSLSPPTSGAASFRIQAIG